MEKKKKNLERKGKQKPTKKCDSVLLKKKEKCDSVGNRREQQHLTPRRQKRKK